MLSRSTYYYEAKIRDSQDEELTELIVDIFKESRNNYGQRKIKVELKKLGWIVSRRRIGRIMKEQGLVSKYTVAQYNPTKTTYNESEIGNVLNRKFNQEKELKVIVSDLTYVRVGHKWHYICVLVDLYNREIIGHSAGSQKTAALVQRAFASVPYNLNRLELFHTDRGSEFKNKLIDEALDAFNIERSLSEKDHLMTMPLRKLRLRQLKWSSLMALFSLASKYLTLNFLITFIRFNNIRIHGSLNYLTPIEYKLMRL